MTNIYSPASRNQADNDSLPGLLRIVLTKFLQGVDDMLPALVIAYDTETNQAQLQPMISMVTTDNRIVERAQVASVPVAQWGGGGFVMRFPVKTGDFGWIKANDRDISLFKQTSQMSQPNTQRKHSFEDAVFFPDTMLAGIAIASEDAANAVFQNADGSVKISLAQDRIKILAPKGVGIGGTPDPNAVLDLQSTTQAFIPPRMSTSQKNAIAAVAGMVVYDTTEGGLSVYNGSAWS